MYTKNKTLFNLVNLQKVVGGNTMDEGLKNLIDKAENGDVEAMVMVGDCFNRGFHTEKDDVKAHEYYKMAADKGNPGAAFMVSIGYLNGIGIRKNKSEAVKYMKIAADKEVSNAQYLLGALYEANEVGILFQQQKAVYYLEKASKQGHAKAQLLLGDINLKNNGIHYSLENGLFWYICAYMHGNNAKEESQEAMNKLNKMLSIGLPGGKERIDKIIKFIKVKYPLYIENPKN